MTQLFPPPLSSPVTNPLLQQLQQLVGQPNFGAPPPLALGQGGGGGALSTIPQYSPLARQAAGFATGAPIGQNQLPMAAQAAIGRGTGPAFDYGSYLRSPVDAGFTGRTPTGTGYIPPFPNYGSNTGAGGGGAPTAPGARGPIGGGYVAPGAVAAEQTALQKMFAKPSVRFGSAAILPLAAQAMFGGQLGELGQQEGATGFAGRFAQGALSGATIGAPIAMLPGGITTIAGLGIIAGSGLLSALSGSGKTKADASKVLTQVLQSGGFDANETSDLLNLVSLLKEANTPDEAIITQLLIPAVQQKSQQREQEEAYVTQIKDFFTQQQQAIGQQATLAPVLSAPLIQQMRDDADQRAQLITQITSDPNIPASSRSVLMASQGGIANAQRSLADSYAAQISLAPYYAQQQQQSALLAQLQQYPDMFSGMLPSMIQQQQTQLAGQNPAQAGDILSQILGQ